MYGRTAFATGLTTSASMNECWCDDSDVVHCYYETPAPTTEEKCLLFLHLQTKKPNNFTTKFINSLWFCRCLRSSASSSAVGWSNPLYSAAAQEFASGDW